MNYSFWLMNKTYRVDVIRHAAAEWTATARRVVDNQRVATGYAYSPKTALGELYDALVGLEMHQLAEALDRADLTDLAQSERAP